VYCCQCSYAVPARPSNKSRLVVCETFGSDEGNVVGICLLGVCIRKERLSNGAEFCVGGGGEQNFDGILVAV